MQKIDKKIIFGLAILVVIGLASVTTAITIKNIVNNKVDNESIKGKNNIEKTEKSVNQELGLNCKNGWMEYSHNVLGMAFCYPEKWGKPTTSYIKNITRLENMEETFVAQNIYYENALDIKFEYNLEDNKQINIRLFNDKYRMKDPEDTVNEPVYYYDTGTTNDIASLINSGSVCDYKIGHNYIEPQSNTFKTIYSSCTDGIRTVLTENKQFFDFSDPKTLYTYNLGLLYFRKINNNYFDNVLIRYEIDDAHQIFEELATLDDFFNNQKTTNVENGLSKKTVDEFNNESNEFKEFSKTIVAFNPILKVQDEFKQISGEDKNITTIRKYYWLIASGKLDDAYAIYANKTKVNVKTFKNIYKDAYSAEPFDINKIGENKYEFYLNYQDYNSNQQKFHVIADVKDNTLDTTFLEEYMSDVVKFKNMTAYSAQRGDKNYMILKVDDKETIIDEGDANYDKDFKNIPDVKAFYNIQFSPNGNYITYFVGGWEMSSAYIYDIKENKKLTGDLASTLLSSFMLGFSKDEKFFYTCSSAGMASGPGGKIYSVSDFKVKYNVLDNPESKNFINVDCSYNENDNLIEFKLSGKDNSNGEYVDYNKIITLKYNLLTGKIE